MIPLLTILIALTVCDFVLADGGLRDELAGMGLLVHRQKPHSHGGFGQSRLPRRHDSQRG